MKRIVLFVIAVLMLSSCADRKDKPVLMMCSPRPSGIGQEYVSEKSIQKEQKYEALNYNRVKAVWVSYLELAPIIGNGEDTFRKEFDKICKNCCDIGFNTVFAHVRTFSDSFYPSEYYGQSKAFNGKSFDALSCMVEIAHSYKLSFHAWINPLRCETKQYIKTVSEGTLIGEWLSDPKKYDEYVVYVEKTGHYWLNPAVTEIRQLIADGVAEIVRGYDVDGIHIDDYFYPTNEPFFDSGIYIEQNVDKSLSEWRTENCSEMVSQLYRAVKEENSLVEFGIAPQGNIENNYYYLFADVKRWCSEDGFCDYIVPQIYFGYNNKYKPYSETLKVWSEMCSRSNKKLVIGIGAYKIMTEDEFIYDKGIVVRQAADALDLCDGAAMFSYNSFFGNDRAEEERARLKEFYQK